jgi:hypothetical protein
MSMKVTMTKKMERPSLLAPTKIKTWFISVWFTLMATVNVTLACTSFGVLTDTGSIIAKNRDYYYDSQYFIRMEPIKQFNEWVGNPYHHRYPFYALVTKTIISFGINPQGLAVVQEDPPSMSPITADGKTSSNPPLRRYIQPYVGYSEDMIIYGLLQNFATVEEIIPYIHDIFSTAAPSFYQIADAKQILTVEVAYADKDTATKRPFRYQLIKKKGGFYAHTNTYLSPEFETINALAPNQKNVAGAKYRLQKITNHINAAKGDFSHAFSWFLDTHSDLGSQTDKHFCLNTSLFRSNLKDVQRIQPNTRYENVYGTVSTFVVEHKANVTIVHLRIIDEIETFKNGYQKIAYRELVIRLSQLFSDKILRFQKGSFVRQAVVDETCK